MKTAVISFSLKGMELAETIKQGLQERGMEVSLFTKCRYAENSVKESLQQWCAERFEDSQAIVFVGASGIAVRAVAPFVTSKQTDPAVIVADEGGNFSISLLSGHLGGANELAEQIGRITGAAPVITTATDVGGKPAIDVFAKKNRCRVAELKKIKVISSAVLAGETVGYCSVFSAEGPIPAEFCEYPAETFAKPAPSPAEKKGVAVSPYLSHSNLFEETLQLIPACITLGIGCRRGISKEAVREAVNRALAEGDIDRRAVVCAASIDLKKDEEGLKAYLQEEGIPFVTYSAERLLKEEGAFSPSQFVEAVTGVDNVCERSALACAGEMLAGQQAELIVRKYCQNGVTVAAAMKKRSVKF